MNLQKQPPIRLKKIRESARGQACQVNSPACNYDDTTTRLIHYRTHGDNAGASLKPDDTAGCYSCSECDLWLGEGNRGSKDREAYKVLEYHNRQIIWFMAMRKTWRLLIVNGVLK